MNDFLRDQYLEILKEELVPALGCTEPIAIAFAAATARDVLGSEGAIPERIIVHCSGNIIKNVKSVVVPNTGGLRGIEASALAGFVSANAKAKMEVLTNLDKSCADRIAELLEAGVCRVFALKTDKPLHIIVEVEAGNDCVCVEIADTHTNIVRIEKNGQILSQSSSTSDKSSAPMTDRSALNVADIIRFANSVELDCVRGLIERQIACNMAIAEEGLSGEYGVNIGYTLLQYEPNNLFNKIKAYTASASEARMSGSELPVVTNSGSGNQGIASSVPVILYARENGIGDERLIRALVLSNLLTIHQKTLIGRLSAFCGVVCASCSSGAALTYLAGGTNEQIEMTVTNTLANVSGIVCDGAKPSCGIKIAASLDAAIMAHLLALRHRAYLPGDGVVKANIEDTISSVGRIASEGMKETDAQILRVMLEA